MATTVHSYARFSTKKQEHGDSQRRQDKMLSDFLASGNYRLSNLRAIDPGRSGFKGDKQKALQEFLKILRAKDGRIKAGDILFVEHLDRIGRKGIRPTQDIINEMLRHGLSIAIANPMVKIYQAATDELGDAIELASFAYVARIYSESLSKRIKSFHEGAREQAAKTKKPINSGSPPAWLIRAKGKFEFIHGAKETIEYIFNRTIEGCGGKKLTAELNQKFPCFGYSGLWNERYMRAILNDRRAMGEMQSCIMDDNGNRVQSGEPIVGYYPQAVSEKTWRLANNAAANRRIERGPNKQYVNLFTGLVAHAIDKCPCHVYTFQQKRADGRRVIYRRLKSVHATNGVKDASHETVYIDDFEQAVLRWLRELDVSVFNGQKSRAAELAGLIGQLQAKQRRIVAIEDDETGDVSLLKKQLAKLKDECKELLQEIDAIKTAEDNATADNASHVKFLMEMDSTNENRLQLREAIKRVVKRITILPVKLGTMRKSKVGSLIEIELQNGVRRSMVQCGQSSLAMTFNQDYACGPSLYDLEGKALAKRANGVRNALMTLMQPRAKNVKMEKISKAKIEKMSST